MIRAIRYIVAVFFLLISFSSWCGDVNPSDIRATVGVFVSPPFVIKSGDSYEGIAVDIWDKAAKNKSIGYQFKEYNTFTALFDALEREEIDAAVTNLSITEERARQFDFSFPWYDSGLRVLTTKNPAVSTSNTLNKLYHSGYLASYLWIAGIIMFATVLLTLFDRVFDKEFPRNWFNGLAESFYHIISLITTGKTGHKQLFGAIGRIFAAVWMLVGVGVIAYMTSSVTSVMTAMQFTDNITQLSDLSGRTIAARQGSVSAQVLENKGMKIYPVNHITDGIPAMQKGKIAAIVGDAPVLEYYTKQHPYSELQVVGNIFHHDKYGFAFPQNSRINRDLSLEIIKLTENGTLSEIKKRYLGE
ncbi:transporter substrate-binding domain-containing protein [Salmonella enterica]|nr:transporter substrate-binding domain-containing protein [Salmonella enterica]EDM5313012.1 ABC transporter substrate-binding protein [Salmonella enterica subsp. enterica serovar Weltevreden]EHB3750468.1 transporter substrate-binding domain-containing protein [Salmonella enterica subsp. enterica serovar Newport]EHM9697370.1 transporter substrate-binding domain-containing protein [Salmonella enterica subsp. enterica serovar 4,[5],12,[27]:-:1,2]EIQ8263734.1 transporter substrate-binding domain-c